MQKTFEEWLKNQNIESIEPDILILLSKAWRDGYDAGIDKLLDIQQKVNVKKLTEAFGGL